MSRFESAFIDSFMQPQIEFADYFEIETNIGTEIVPADVIGRTCATHVEALLGYLEGEPLDDDEEVPLKEGWLARMHAPGYMDCTEWSAFATLAEAENYLLDTYGDADQDE